MGISGTEYTDIDTYLFRPIDSEAAEVTGISVKSLLYSRKPDGVEFPLLEISCHIVLSL